MQPAAISLTLIHRPLMHVDEIAIHMTSVVPSEMNRLARELGSPEALHQHSHRWDIANKLRAQTLLQARSAVEVF